MLIINSVALLFAPSLLKVELIMLLYRLYILHVSDFWNSNSRSQTCFKIIRETYLSVTFQVFRNLP